MVCTKRNCTFFFFLFFSIDCQSVCSCYALIKSTMGKNCQKNKHPPSSFLTFVVSSCHCCVFIKRKRRQGKKKHTHTTNDGARCCSLPGAADCVPACLHASTVSLSLCRRRVSNHSPSRFADGGNYIKPLDAVTVPSPSPSPAPLLPRVGCA